MLSFDPNAQTERENYKLLIGSIIPRPIAFVTTDSGNGVINGAPFSYFSIVSSNPPMVSLSIQRPASGHKDTARNIYRTKEFVVHIVDRDNVEKINETAASLAPDESELIRAGLTPVASEVVAVPGVREAKVRMECRLVEAIPFHEGDAGSDLLIGRVVRFHIDEEIYSNGRIDPRALNAVSRLAGTNYAEIGEIFSMDRPK
ncbi:flavin reductase family protein [Chryseomicrobium palamuruense]